MLAQEKATYPVATEALKATCRRVVAPWVTYERAKPRLGLTPELGPNQIR